MRAAVSWIALQSRLEATERRLEAAETALTAANEAITELTAEKVDRLVWCTTCLHHFYGLPLALFPPGCAATASGRKRGSSHRCGGAHCRPHSRKGVTTRRSVVELFRATLLTSVFPYVGKVAPHDAVFVTTGMCSVYTLCSSLIRTRCRCDWRVRRAGSAP